MAVCRLLLAATVCGGSDMSARPDTKVRLPVLFVDLKGHLWVNARTNLRPVVVGTKTRTFRLRRATAEEVDVVRDLIQGAATEAWAKITA